ncbi:MAG: TlpA family protein disulfide reductase [Candidatus Bathyarchaeia archaeon]
MTKYDIKSLRKNSETISHYLSSVAETTPAFEKRKAEYELDEGLSGELNKYADEVVIIVFSAEWCPDCHRNMPALGLISEAAGLEVRVFGHLMRASKGSDGSWRIPPSPPEVNVFNVIKIPLIVVLDKDGRKLGEIVENPPEGVKLEEALLDIIKGA